MGWLDGGVWAPGRWRVSSRRATAVEEVSAQRIPCIMNILVQFSRARFSGSPAVHWAPSISAADTVPAPARIEKHSADAATPSDTRARGPWWTVFFRTKTLDCVEAQVTDTNQDLTGGVCRLEKATGRRTRIEGRCPVPASQAGVRVRFAIQPPKQRTTSASEPRTYNDFCRGGACPID